MGEEQTEGQISIKEMCFNGRKTIEELKQQVFALKGHDVFNCEQKIGEMRDEMKANIMLAYRHLEDARMRLGKVVQAYDGGKSVYPK